MAVFAAGGFLIAGLIGCFAISLFVEKFQYVRLVIFISIIAGSGSYIAIFLALYFKILSLIICFTALGGFFLIPLRGLLMSACCGSTSDATEHVINGFVISTYTAGSIITVFYTSKNEKNRLLEQHFY